MTIKHLFPVAKPTLDLNFAAERSLDPRITFSRSSIGTYMDATGILRYAAEDEPRFDHSGTGESLGLLIEEARTNELKNSDLSGLTEYGCETENSTEVNPEGVASCKRIIVDAGRNSEGHRITKISDKTDQDTTMSVFVKMDTHPYVLIGGGGQNNGYTAAFNIDPAFTGDRLLGQSGAGTRTNIGAGYESYANGWFRIWASGNTTGTDGWSLSISPDENTFKITNWDAAGTEAIFAYGGQYEYAAFVTSYIPTSGAPEDRDADTATVDTTGLYGDEFTIITEPFGVASGSNPLSLYGVHNKRTSVYPRYLPQEQINSVAKVGDFWRWRVLGSSWEIKPTMSGSVTVDWGDGTTESLSSAVVVNHTFTNGSGYHEVGFRLDSGSWFSVNLNYTNAADREKVVAVGPMPASMVITGYYSYNYLSNLTAWDANIVHIYGGLNSYQLGGTYAGLTSLKSFPFTVLDPLITSLSQAWTNCSNLNSFPLIDTSSIENFGQAWSGCASLPSFPHIDTSSGTNFSSTWQGCSDLTSFPSLNTSSGTNFQGAWRGCKSLTSFPLLDTSSGENFKEAWSGCNNLTSFPLIDTSSSTTFENTWSNCWNLLSFPPLLNTSSVNNFSKSWSNCTSLTSFPLLDTSSATNFQECWYRCRILADFPANFFDTTGTAANADAFKNAFTDCALTAQSIENILVSLDTNGASGLRLDINGGTNAAQSSWSTAANTALANLQAKGWTVYYNS